MGDSHGFTTGSCAAAAAKAAAVMLFEGAPIKCVSIMTPSGREYSADIVDIMSTCNGTGSKSVSCAVRKPKSDDPDVTAGMLIYAKAELAGGNERNYVNQRKVIIEGGRGIGKVTKPGLDQPVGEYAINSVPRGMIEQEVLAVMEEYEYDGSVRIEISAPEGEEIAAKTFNPKLGIEGGISIIGTSGIVEPMSTKALIDTIAVELRQQKALQNPVAVVSPGNYGFDFMRERYGYDLEKAVKCSNYIGETIDIAKELGFSKTLLVGHMGKLIKISGGIMNTHSSFADCRMELMAAAAVRAGADADVLENILDSVSTEEAYEYMIEAGIEKKCARYITEKIAYHLTKRAGDMKIGCIVYSSRHGLIGATDGAEAMLREVCLV